MSVEEDTVALKVNQHEYISKTDSKYRKLFLRACNPPDSIVRGSEGTQIQILFKIIENNSSMLTYSFFYQYRLTFNHSLT